MNESEPKEVFLAMILILLKTATFCVGLGHFLTCQKRGVFYTKKILPRAGFEPAT